MFRKTITGSLMAVSLTAGALMTMSPASASPTWVESASISHSGLLPKDAAFAMSENGTAVASWLRKVDGVYRVQASYFTGGANGFWTFPDTITYSSDVVASPGAAINDKGEAVATWLEEDNSGDLRVASSRYLGNGSFDARDLVSTDNQLDSTGPISTQLDGAGRIWVAHRDTDGATKNRIRVSTKSKTGSPVSVVLTDDTSFTPSLAVNDKGQAVVAWYDAGNGESQIKVRRYVPEQGIWNVAKETGGLGLYGSAEVSTSMNDNGDAVVGFTRRDGDGDYRAQVSKARVDGTVTSGTYAALVQTTSTGVDVAVNDAGRTLVSWSEETTDHRVRFTARDYNGSFTTISTVAGNLAAATRTDAAISDSGMSIVGFTDDGEQRAAYRLSALGPVLSFNSGPLGFQAGETGVGVDNQGNAFLGGVTKTNVTDGSVHGAFLDTAGPVAKVTAPGANSLGNTLKVVWSATDRFSAVEDGRLRMRVAAWNGGFGSYTYPGGFAPESFVNLAASPGRTYCFSAQARDAHVNTDSFGAEKCTTTPVDDRALKMAGGFSRKNGGAHYRGTFTQATKNGATLTLKNVKASRIAILVTKVANGGKIQVKFGSKVLGTYSLKGTGLKQLVAQKSLGGLKTGTLTIKVVSPSGKVVKIDGVVAAK